MWDGSSHEFSYPSPIPASHQDTITLPFPTPIPLSPSPLQNHPTNTTKLPLKLFQPPWNFPTVFSRALKTQHNTVQLHQQQHQLHNNEDFFSLLCSARCHIGRLRPSPNQLCQLSGHRWIHRKLPPEQRDYSSDRSCPRCPVREPPWNHC